MKYGYKNIVLGIVLSLLAACGDTEDQKIDGTEKINSTVDTKLVAAVHETADKRVFNKALMLRAVNEGYPEALHLFALSGDTACIEIRSYLMSQDTHVLKQAVKGVAKCADANAFDNLITIARNETLENSIRIAALKALGFASGEDHRGQIAALVTTLLQQSDSAPEIAAAGIYGLMQNIVYAGVSPSALPELDMQFLMQAAKRNDRLGFEAAYLLMRMQGLRATLDFTEVKAAIEASELQQKTYALLRVAGQFGNAASKILRQNADVYSDIEGDLSVSLLNDAETVPDTAGAINGMVGLDDETSLTHLFKLLNASDAAVQQMALAIMSRRSDADSAVVKRMWDFARGENEWLAVTAASGLAGFGDPNALYLAEEWLEAGSFYKAFQAVGLLSRSPEGQELLQNYAATAADPVRVQMVLQALDPRGVEPRMTRETVPYETAVASVGKKLRLSTTRGEIIIEMIEGAPYTAHAFITLANEGKFDDMIWHRVIPGFVAQAGQRDDMSQFKTPTIREEWGAAPHEPGTVGLATSGPDTGTAQFFINLMHNRHLDDRYTVFGRVVSGPYGALQEGDIITKAEVMD